MAHSLLNAQFNRAFRPLLGQGVEQQIREEPIELN